MKAELKGQQNLKVVSPQKIPHFYKNGEVGAVLDMWLNDTKTGLIIPDSRLVKKSESFLQQYLQILYAQMKQLSQTNPLGDIPISNGGASVYGTGVSGANWVAAMFTPTVSGGITALLVNTGGGDIYGATAHIRATSGGLPTGADLDTATCFIHYGGWGYYLFGAFTTGYVLQAGVTYAICLSTAGSFGWNYVNNATPGAGATSTDGGSTWTSNNTLSCYQIAISGESAVMDTAGSSRCIYALGGGGVSIALDVLAGAANTNFGIVAGTDGTAPVISDHALHAQIAEGSGAGRLNHGAVAFGNPASDSSVSQFTITRNLANNTANPITVNELGLYCRCYDYSTLGEVVAYFAIIRDAVTKTIPNGQTLTVNYREQVSS